MSAAERFDVVVAGGGPVGLMLAAELGLAGVRTVALEREPEPSVHSRAWGLHARSAETLDRRGLLEPLLRTGATWPKMPFAGLWPLLELSPLPSDHPYIVNVPQTAVEKVLSLRAAEAGAEVRRGQEVVGFTQDDSGVSVEVRGGSGEIRASYLVGCDGGRSTVRRLAGVDFPGTDPTLASMLCDCTLPDMANERRGITRTASGTVNLNPRPGGTARVVVTEFGRTHDDRDEAVTFEEFQAAVRRVLGRDVTMTEPTWLARFADTTRHASQYRAGRVLLAGDAAHVHFPYGGLGLNLGLQDAVNLGWKLAAQVHGWAPESLLDSYHAERHPVAETVLTHSRAQLALFNPHPDVTALRGLFAELLGFEEVNRHLAEFTTGVSTRYDLGSEGGPLAGRFAVDVPVKGPDGATSLVGLLRTGRGVLLDLAGGRFAEAASGWAGRVDAVVAAADDQAGWAAALVRPDGYLAWADGPDAAEAGLVTALTRWFGSPA